MHIQNYKTTGVSLDAMRKVLLKHIEWYKSSINIAVKLIAEIDKIDNDSANIKRPGWTDCLYYRGLKVVMK
jgi:hypothetical protein